MLPVCGPTTYPFPQVVAEFQAPGAQSASFAPASCMGVCLARGTRLTGFALCLPQSACNLLSTCLVARPYPALFLGGQDWDFAVSGWPCLYRESSVYITVLRRMISALPGLVITSADWKSTVGTPRRNPAWMSTPIASCARAFPVALDNTLSAL